MTRRQEIEAESCPKVFPDVQSGDCGLRLGPGVFAGLHQRVRRKDGSTRSDTNMHRVRQPGKKSANGSKTEPGKTARTDRHVDLLDRAFSWKAWTKSYRGGDGRGGRIDRVVGP